MTKFFKIFNVKYGLRRILKNLYLSFSPFSLFELYHHPQPFLKSNIIEVLKKYPNEVKRTRESRFKKATNLNQYIFRYYHLIKGDFAPYNPKDTLYVGVSSLDDLTRGIDKIKKNSQVSIVCFNEHPGFDLDKYGEYKRIIRNYLESILPDKATFEK